MGENFTASGGLYKKPFLVVDGNAQPDIELTLPDIELTEPLTGIEKALENHILEDLVTHPNRPTVALDFGGMLGLSFIRIAARNKQCIKDGKLGMLISNRAFVPDMIIQDDAGYTGVARLLNSGKQYDYLNKHSYTSEELQFVNENQKFVTYVSAVAGELAWLPIIRRGKVTNLVGKVSVIHEEKVLIHSEAPDAVLLDLLSLLSQGGTIIIGTQEWLYDRVIIDPPNIDHSHARDVRRRVHRRGIFILNALLQAKSKLDGDYHTVFTLGEKFGEL